MGYYKAHISNATFIRLEHLPEGSGQTVEFRMPEAYVSSQIKEGETYTISFSASKVTVVPDPSAEADLTDIDTDKSTRT